ncbi:MAG: HigA family addiction module antitoxin [Burkholderiales bacterium]
MATSRKQLDEIHPGEILLEDFMKPMSISARQLAADMDVAPSRISELVHGRRPITADTALRLGLFFSMEPRFWMNLQAEYDMRVAKQALHDKIASRIRAFEFLLRIPLEASWVEGLHAGQQIHVCTLVSFTYNGCVDTNL